MQWWKCGHEQPAVVRNASCSGQEGKLFRLGRLVVQVRKASSRQEGQLFRSGRQVVHVRKASCSGQTGQEGQLFRSGRPVVQVRKTSCSGQTGQEGQLFRSDRPGRPVVQVRPVRKANHYISEFQEAESRRTY